MQCSERFGLLRQVQLEADRKDSVRLARRGPEGIDGDGERDPGGVRTVPTRQVDAGQDRSVDGIAAPDPGCDVRVAADRGAAEADLETCDRRIGRVGVRGGARTGVIARVGRCGVGRRTQVDAELLDVEHTGEGDRLVRCGDDRADPGERHPAGSQIGGRVHGVAGSGRVGRSQPHRGEDEQQQCEQERVQRPDPRH